MHSLLPVIYPDTHFYQLFCVAFTCTHCNILLQILFYVGMHCDVNFTTLRTFDSIGPTLHFWYFLLHGLLLCKCNARCCLKYLLQIGQLDIVECVDSNAYNRCIFWKYETVRSVSSIPIIMFLVLQFSYKTYLLHIVIFVTVTNISNFAIVLFIWSYNVYCTYIHVLNKKWP